MGWELGEGEVSDGGNGLGWGGGCQTRFDG
jgi:hypothetical protein